MQRYKVHYIRPDELYRERQVIVLAETFDEAKWIAPIQFGFPTGTRITHVSRYAYHQEEGRPKVVFNGSPEAQLYYEVLERIRDGYYDEDDIPVAEKVRRKQQFRNEIGAINGSPKNHEAIMNTAERQAAQFKITGKTTKPFLTKDANEKWTREWRVVDPHRLINVMDWYRQLAATDAEAPGPNTLMEVVKPRDNRVGARLRRKNAHG